ncbi:hypothetical protein ASE27_03880 [Oerskovia sp. Root918]|nr:hypothetical protein ASE27_03880 [Oerskovia sp. Root918]
MRDRRRTTTLSLLLVVSVAWLSAAVPLIWTQRYYWWDDTVNGAFGQWYHTGMMLRSGTLPMLEPSTWSSGNLFAEGQWGQYNPLIWLISLGATLVEHVGLYVTIVKFIAIAFGAVGTYLLARHLGARNELAILAGFTAPFSGFTTYFDAPSWVTGLFAWSLIPWVWYLLRRASLDGKNPLPAFVSAYLVVTIGYVHGTIALIFVLVGLLTFACVEKNRRSFLTTLGVGILSGLVALAVYLPSVLTASVTNRSTTRIAMDQFMTLDLSGIGMSGIPTALPQVVSWWWGGFTAAVPMAYIVWAVPLLAFVDLSLVSRVLRQKLDVVVALGLFFVFLMLPTVMGPLRYPSRMMPYLALTAILLIAVLLSLARATEITYRRLFVAWGLAAFGAFLAWAQAPNMYKAHVASFLLVALATAVLFTLWKASGRRKPYIGQGSAAVVAVVALTSLAALVLQHAIIRAPAWPDQGLPATISGFQKQLPGAVNDTLVVGDPQKVIDEPGLWDETLQANTWYANPASVLNRYQLVGFSAFNATLCLEYLGGTCPELLRDLFKVRDQTGMSLVDEIRIDTIQIIKGDVPRRLWAEVPDGWHIVQDGDLTQTWVRDVPLGPAGGVVWASPGVTVSESARTNTSVTFTVDALPQSGDRTVAFSRLSWPGYSTSAGRIGEPVDSFLLAVDLPAESVGEEVTVTFRPPGWTVQLACIALALGGAALWSGWAAWTRRRHGPEHTSRGRNSRVGV